MQKQLIQKQLVSFILLFAFFSCNISANPVPKTTKEPVDYVNPYMGNISHLLVPTFPMTHLPHSMLRVHPLRGDYTSDRINGLPLIMPKHRRQGIFQLCPMTESTLDLRKKPSYYYDFETIKPYKYSVWLENVGVQVDYAPSYQSALYKLQYEEAGKQILALNINKGQLKFKDGISGYGIYENDTKYFVYIEFDQKPVSIDAQDQSVMLTFDSGNKTISVRYAISFISEEQAKKNLERELQDYDVEKLATDGRKIWNEYLSKIQVEGGSEENKTIFYTSLYRTAERMVLYSEDGQYYSPFDRQVHNDQGSPFYNDDWIWDTYLATHPLSVLINPEMEVNKIKSYIRMYKQSGWVPTFPGPTGDDHCMNGNHYVAMIWDAYSKGLTGFDLEKAYEGCKKTIMEESMLPWRRGTLTELDLFFQQNGYYPALHPGEEETCKEVNPGEKRQTVAVTQSAAFDDWCMAQMAKQLKKTEDYEFFLKRSFNYRNLFNPETGFFHPKDKNGIFIEPFDYVFSGGQGARDYYDENNAWTYRWGVQHNIPDLIQLMGGAEKFSAAMDEMFVTPLGKSKFEFYRVLPDQTGNVGQFTMANEPSFHIPYLYNYAGQPWKTQKRIRSVIDQWMRNDLMGIPGDEDGGGMSAFTVFSMMGFYPVTPGNPIYNIGSPFFEKMTMQLGNGKNFTIVAKGCSKENKYVQSVKLNGKELDQVWFSHSDIANGGTLELVMGNRPNKTLGTINVPK